MFPAIYPDPEHLLRSGCSLLTPLPSFSPHSGGHQESPAHEGPQVRQECRERMALMVTKALPEPPAPQVPKGSPEPRVRMGLQGSQA